MCWAYYQRWICPCDTHGCKEKIKAETDKVSMVLTPCVQDRINGKLDMSDDYDMTHLFMSKRNPRIVLCELQNENSDPSTAYTYCPRFREKADTKSPPKRSRYECPWCAVQCKRLDRKTLEMRNLDKYPVQWE